MTPRGPFRKTSKRPQPDDQPLSRIVEELVDRRYQLGMTQHEVAELTGESQARISDFETLRNTPGLDRVLRYAGAVGAKLMVVSEK